MRGRWLLGLLVAPLGCTPSPTPWRGADAHEWPLLLDELARLRQVRRRAPWAAGLRATLRPPRSGQVLDARGGIAVAPGRALRMILVAAAGTTVLDAWVTPDRWRIAVPPLSLVRRGGSDEPRELPVAFLRWWFFRPLQGMLFAATNAAGPHGAEPLLLLRERGAVVELRVARCLRVRRRSASRTERVEECASQAPPQAGDRVEYEDESSGLVVDLVFESVADEAPREEAFVDPDVGGGP
jgi:hypothetical protein